MIENEIVFGGGLVCFKKDNVIRSGNNKIPVYPKIDAHPLLYFLPPVIWIVRQQEHEDQNIRNRRDD